MQKFTALWLVCSFFLYLCPPSFAQDNQSATAAPCVSWINPLVPPRFALLCIHGLGLYSRSYEQFAQRMMQMGGAVYAIDVRGFGSWMKAQGHEQIDFTGCLQDIKTALDSIHTAHPELPIFLLGESMGGAIALRAASMYPDSVTGLISSVPAGERFQNKRTDLKVALHMLKGPNRQFNIGKSIIEQASTDDRVDGDKKVKVLDTKEMDDWESDPLDRMSLSPKELMQFQIFMNDNHDAAKKIVSLPVLFVQGIDDHLVRPDGTWDLFKELTTHNRTMVALPSRHLIFEQSQDSKRVVSTASTRLVAAWILTQLGETLPLPAIGALLGGNLGGALIASANASANSSTNINTNINADADPHNAISSDPSINTAITLINQNNFAGAQTGLQQVLQKEPASAEAHYWLGVALLKQGILPQARDEFRQSMALGAGSGHSNEANTFLLSLDNPAPLIPKPLQDLAKLQHHIANRKTAAAATETGRQLSGGTPTVLVFSADWCAQCANVDAMLEQGREMFGDKVRFTKIDITKPENGNLVKEFSIGPIPTIVFLDRQGTVSSTLIGQNNIANVAKRLAAILP